MTPVREEGHMNIPEELRYTSKHEWVKVEGSLVRVGITDHAQDALGDVVYVSLPEPGATVVAKEACCEVESDKSISDVSAPVSGRIAEVNTELVQAPQTINEDSYDKGWLFAIEIADASEVDGLLDASGYRSLLDEL
jgi:glycine cleavage system H protein